MRGVVRDILRQVERSGMPGNHHFFVSYRTDYPGVEMSDSLRAKYPREITIVLQHQFWDLKIEDMLFRVSLSFNNIPERLVVPFAALLGFADPSTKFGLQFHSSDESGLVSEIEENKDIAEELPKETAKIITLDSFRKK
ncbi:MAG: ClpXP protease specificity-enhancing factor SspB [Pseudomonadota bacterium]